MSQGRYTLRPLNSYGSSWIDRFCAIFSRCFTSFNSTVSAQQSNHEQKNRCRALMRLSEIIAGFVPFAGQLEYPLHLFGRPFGFTCGDKGLPTVEALHQLEISLHTLTPVDLRNIQ